MNCSETGDRDIAPIQSISPPTTNGTPKEAQLTPAPNGRAPPGPGVNRFTARAAKLKHRLSKKKTSIKLKAKPPGGFDRTPLPDAPPGYTVKFTFYGAENLPAADFHTRSSDPFLIATVTPRAPRLLKRHKEDPDLVHRTRPVRKSLEPQWNEEWIVANVPAAGFDLKCRIYDEDYPSNNDRLGNVTVNISSVSENGIVEAGVEGSFPSGGKWYEVDKKVNIVYFIKACTSLVTPKPFTAKLQLGIEVLGKSNPPHGQMYTIGPTSCVKHFSPMIGRMVGTKVNRDENDDVGDGVSKEEDRRTKKYDFQANEMQLSGPVPPRLYHRYVEFRPLVGLVFSRSGMRGKILNIALHKQHWRIYNFDSSTQHHSFPSCSEAAAVQFLRLAHFDDGGRVFTYVLTLDGMLRFTETGKEFGIAMLSKHSMHSDVATYIACAGEFLIKRNGGLEEPHKSGSRKQPNTKDLHHSMKTQRRPTSQSSWKSRKRHPSVKPPGDTVTKGPLSTTEPDSQRFEEEPKNRSSTDSASQYTPKLPQPETEIPVASSSLLQSLHPSYLFGHGSHSSTSPRPSTANSACRPPDPSLYTLYIDNDSGTYRPDKSILPDLKAFLERNFPGLNIVARDWEDEELKELKKEKMELKKKKGRMNYVLNRSPSSSSMSGAESELDSMEEAEEAEEDSGIREKKKKAKGILGTVEATIDGKGKGVEGTA